MHPKIHILLLSLPLKKEQRVDISYARNVRLTFHFPLARSPSPSTIDFNNFIVAPSSWSLLAPLPIEEHDKFVEAAVSTSWLAVSENGESVPRVP